MKKLNYMGEISDMFQISPSTLRYWEDECLIKFSRNEENNYRLLSFQTALDICDIIFYRNLSIPLKEIKLIPSMNICELECTLTKNEEKLIKKIDKLKRTVEKIKSKKRIIEKLKYLQSNPCYIEKQTLSPIKLFDFSPDYTNKELIQFYLSLPNKSVIIINPEKSITDYGTFVSETDNNIFRQKDHCEKLYLRGLLKVESDNMYNNNYSELILDAEKLGYKTNVIIGQYLISACEDKKYDYYETWIELF